MTLSARDLTNLQVLMSKFIDGEDNSWKPLLTRQWSTLSALLDALQDHICPQDRREFRQMVDQLWVSRR